MVFKQMQLTNINNLQHLLLEITSHCNLHCPQCPRFQSDGYLQNFLTPAHLDFYVLEKSVNLEVLSNLEKVTFEGDYGDCLMHPQIENFIDFFKSVPQIKLVTNGSIRNINWYKHVAQYSNVEITFSIDGLEDTNSYYRINSDWNKIIKNVKSFINAGGVAHWKFIVFKHNQHQIEQARELSKQLGFTSFTTQYSNRNFFGTTNWPVMIDGVYQYDLEISDAIDPKPGKTHIISSSRANEFTCPECDKPWLLGNNNTLYVNHRGHLLPCCMTSAVTYANGISDRLFRKIIGNINDIDLHHHSIIEILNSDFYTHRLKESWNNEKTAHHLCVASCSKKTR